MKVLGRKLFLLKGERGGGGDKEETTRRSLFEEEEEEDLFLRLLRWGPFPIVRFQIAVRARRALLCGRVKQISSF